MLTSHYLGSHVPDAVGSLIIASLLGSVASFMIYTNSAALGKHYVLAALLIRIRDRFFPDPGSRIPDPKPYIFESLMIIFGLKGLKFFVNWPKFFFYTSSKIK
jgi:hypothetical protein